MECLRLGLTCLANCYLVFSHRDIHLWNRIFAVIKYILFMHSFGAVFSSQLDYNLFVSSDDVLLLLKEYISPHLQSQHSDLCWGKKEVKCT